jgi:catechol 2,3-dioxygenase-like lactoylglutathione lyase family enzyme
VTDFANRLTHVVYGVRPENLAESVAFWESLGASFDQFERSDYGLTIHFDWDRGVELIAPTGIGEPADRLREFLEDHGEGIFTVDFGVADLRSAMTRASDFGLSTRAVAQTMKGDEPWFHRFVTLTEARILDRDDLRLMLAHVVPRQGERSNPRVSHVGFGVRMENLAAARHFWEWNFGLQFEEPITLDPGLKVLYAPAGGIELVAATDERAPDFVAEPLARWGEGPFVTAYVVDNLAEALAALAIDPLSRLSYTGHPDWVDRYERLEQAILPEVHGMRVALTEMQRRAAPVH